ncbi:putative vesicular fusion ATPase [Talaromyces proteolyticus]|uniref:Vesicular-fusion protein SEC18 n=1 Tax=Talaromyces proteolyticus TaxID=1131652 RepID=A0AAD4Q169_9EURO|nr:putative vesicular fusion ATPase [Talaromyces proteolyticus]KAH8701974.1 putative vesicular fusion ATPase [Talaromyces proteolyticus]
MALFNRKNNYGGSGEAPPMNNYGRPPSTARRLVRDGQDQGQGAWNLRATKNKPLQFENRVLVTSLDFPPSNLGNEFYLLVKDRYVFTAQIQESIRNIHPEDKVSQGQIGFGELQRTWAGIGLTDSVKVQIYKPFNQERGVYLGAINIEIGFYKGRRTEDQYDQDDLANVIKQEFQNQIFAPGQKLLMSHQKIPLALTIKTVELIDLISEKQTDAAEGVGVTSDASARGILTPHTVINFYSDGKGIRLKPSDSKPPVNAIIRPDFQFETLGIGGLDSEFSTIFRRAFASRVFPRGLINKLGIQHVKGILLYGPPGTGKTLIARQIGQMLNAREPKIINGPEVLNKYVGQSEENIRKLFADAEKEYKQRGDESELHIIIFDELDAVCKQRGSGAGGGTGVGDSVVNQLLSKLDGVDQLNNILLIGMTNRKDMIDDALLRPGRLEVHMEISLPDEKGRAQILKIHTQKMTENHAIEPDVDLQELAHLTKNYSGAEIFGLVKAATSFAFNRHVEPGTLATVKKDVVDLKVRRDDFLNALEEVKPAFGVSEEELENCVQQGIIDYSTRIKDILEEGRLFVNQVGAADATPLFSVLFHGPSASGKTALAARIAIDSGFPFIRLISPEDMVGFNEPAKIQHITKVFTDAYKSRTSIVVVDNIERIIDWVPIGSRFSNSVLQTLMVFLTKHPANRRRLLILATTTERSLLRELDMYNSFNADIRVPTVDTRKELQYILEYSEAFESKEIEEILEGIYGLDKDKKIGVGIKRILLGIETAKQDKEKTTRFINVVNRIMDQERSVSFRG